MTLSRQLFAGITAIFLVLLIGIEAIYVSTARSHLKDQLDAHANETATSLALSLGSRVQALEQDMVNTMVNPVFDRGYYALIEVGRTGGESVFKRTMHGNESTVPAWFRALIELEGPKGKALISAGWRQLGTVSVQIDPEFAYRQLWETALGTLLWLSALFALALVAMRIYVTGILKPLSEIERTANAISNRNFVSIAITPGTRELRSVTEAINSLSGKIRDAISEESARAERLRKEAFEDAMTGELNRRGFQQSAISLLDEGGEVYEGALALFSITGLEEVNRTFGLTRGDDVFRALVDKLKTSASEGRLLIGRWQGPTLAVLVANSSAEQASGWAAGCVRDWSSFLASRGLPTGSSIVAGISPFRGNVSHFDQLANRAESALSVAIKRAVPGEVVVSGDEEQDIAGPRGTIESAIQAGRIALLGQPALSLGDGLVLHMELMSRLSDANGKPIPAAEFVPVASQFGLLPSLDLKMIVRAFDLVAARKDLPAKVSLNVSLQSTSDPTFRSGLRSLLVAHPSVASRLVFEMTGFSAGRHPALAQEFARELSLHGAGLGLDNFDLDRDAMSLLHALRPAYVKMAPVFTRQLGERQDVRFIVEAMVRMLQPLEIPLIAQGVEDPAMIPLLGEIGVSGYQGYASGRPQPLD